jgi:hypothetical protein
MKFHELWVRDGRLVARPQDQHGKVLSDRTLLQENNCVRVDTDTQGTTLTWYMAVANWSSLFFLRDWLGPYSGPFHLRYFNGGWIEETYQEIKSVRSRLDELVSKSDIRLSARAFTQDFHGTMTKITPKLVEMLNSGEPNSETAVVCQVDVDKQNIDIENIGKDSLLANIWGEARTTYPCQTGHSYDKAVSKAYFRALQINRPVCDQVMAAMVKPSGVLHWISYQRVIFPRKHVLGQKPQVIVNCELAPVDIQLF